MAGSLVKVKSSDLRKVSRRLDRVAVKLDDWTVPLTEVGLFLRSRAIERLDERDISNPFFERITFNVLGRSIHTEISDNGKVAITATNTVYARIQQLGGVIKPKGGKKALAIPVDARVARQGIPPRQFGRDGLTFIPIRGGGRSGNAVGWLVENREASRAAKQNRKAEAKLRTRIERIRKRTDEAARRILGTSKSSRRIKSGMVQGLRLAEARQVEKLKRSVPRVFAKPVFLLMRQVTIPSRPYLIVDEEAIDFAVERGLKHIREVT